MGEWANQKMMVNNSLEKDMEENRKGFILSIADVEQAWRVEHGVEAEGLLRFEKIIRRCHR